MVNQAVRLSAVSRAALALGLTEGLTLADARARVPALVAIEHDEAADAALLTQIAEDAGRFTPLVALDTPHGLLFDITGCTHLFGGEEAFRQRVLARLSRAGMTTRGAVAGTPDAARAQARFGQMGIIPPGEDMQAALSLPVAALEMPDDVLVALKRAGFKRLGDLAAQPRMPLAARFGEATIRRFARILGEEDRRLSPLRPIPVCTVEQPFAEPIARIVDMENSLNRLVGRASLLLEARGEGGRAFEATFFRADGVVRRIIVRTGRPVREAAPILRLFRHKLDTLDDPLDPGFGFDLIRLSVPVTRPLAALQPSFDHQGTVEDGVADLVDRLVARLGQSRVLRFTAADTHDPLRAAPLVPAQDMQEASSSQIEVEPGEPPLRPLRLFHPPQPIDALAEVPDGPPLRFRWRRVIHEVARAEGPERIAPEWWRDQDVPTRDYYRVEDAQGRRFWLFRAGLYGRESVEPRWYLHGLFA